jgi:hypothetical protein
MHLFFGDERKTRDSFSLALYGVKETDLAAIADKITLFKLEHNLPNSYEFHFYDDSRHLNQNFISLIQEFNLVAKYFSKTELLSEPYSHISCFNDLIPQIAADFCGAEVRFVFDKLGGKKTEMILKTEINRLCRRNHLKQNRNVKFVDSKHSSFIQIADYLVAMKDRGEI